MAGLSGHIEILEKLWDPANKLQLKPEELRNELWVSKTSPDKWLVTWQEEVATLKYSGNCRGGLKSENTPYLFKKCVISTLTELRIYHVVPGNI
jgi:hypothetical protein